MEWLGDSPLPSFTQNKFTPKKEGCLIIIQLRSFKAPWKPQTIYLDRDRKGVFSFSFGLCFFFKNSNYLIVNLNIIYIIEIFRIFSTFLLSNLNIENALRFAYHFFLIYFFEDFPALGWSSH